MRLAPALVLAALLTTGPAMAQDATTPAAPAAPATEPAPAPAPASVAAPPPVETIGPNADRDFWCALAFSLTSRGAQIGGNEAGAATEAQRSQLLFANLVNTMKAGNFTEQQFNSLTAQYTLKLLDPFAQPAYTIDDCTVALTEAGAALAAAEAAAPAEPTTPEAPAADVPAADAPAAPATP